jgi:hypothetical protein
LENKKETEYYFFRFFVGQSSFLSGQDFSLFLHEESFFGQDSDFLHSPFGQDSFLSHPDLHFPQQDFPFFLSHEDLSQSDLPLVVVDDPFFESQGFLA